MEDYETTFDEFWKDIVTNPDGSLNVDQVKKELHDYSKMLDEVPKVYCHVTGGLISKPNTAAEFVIMEADAVLDRMIQEGVEDRLKDRELSPVSEDSIVDLMWNKK